MSGVFRLYDSYLYEVARGTHIYPTDTLKLALLTDGYVPTSAGTRASLASYSVGDVVYGVFSGVACYLVAVVAGVSDSGTPTMNTSLGGLTSDGSVVWSNAGLAPPSAHAVFADVSANEVSGVGYVAGGATLPYTHALTGRRATLSASDTTWGASTLIAKYAVVYKSGTVGSLTNPLVGYVLLDTLGASKTTLGESFRVQFGGGVVYALSSF